MNTRFKPTSESASTRAPAHMSCRTGMLEAFFQQIQVKLSSKLQAGGEADSKKVHDRRPVRKIEDRN